MVKKIVNNDMSEVLASKCALVDFSAAWCGPCNMIGPVVERLSEERDDVEFFNVDVDKNPDLAMKYRIQITELFIRILPTAGVSMLLCFTGKIVSNF